MLMNAIRLPESTIHCLDASEVLDSVQVLNANPLEQRCPKSSTKVSQRDQQEFLGLTPTTKARRALE